MALKITISFKEEAPEIEMYNFIKAQLSPSVYVKSLTLADMKKQNELHPPQARMNPFENL